MAEYGRQQRIIQSVDPVTGETIYRDEVTGEILPAGTYVPPVTQVSETVITESTTGPATFPAPGQVVTQHTVTGASPAGYVTPAPGVHTQASEVYTEDPYAPRRAAVRRLQQAIYLVFGILEALLAIRFVLRLLGANAQSGFASFIYGITAPFMAPFAGLFGQPAAGGSVVEFNALVAIVIYALLAWVLMKVAWLVGGETRSGVRTSRVNRRIDQ